MRLFAVALFILTGFLVGILVSFLIQRKRIATLNIRIREGLAKQIESERILELKMRESNDAAVLYSSALDSFDEGILIADFKCVILYFNKAFLSIFSLPNDYLGKKISDITGYPILDTMATSCISKNNPIQGETVLYRGVARHLAIRSSPFALGENRGVLVVVDDITALKRLENIRKDFVANVSHELRTPIQLVRGFAELLSSEAYDETVIKKYAAIIEHNSSRMERIIADLLTLARLENDPGTWLIVESCRLADILASAVSVLEPKASAKNITIKIECPTGLFIIANPGLIEQAIVNLLENAYQYSHENTCVEIQVDDEGGFIHIFVKDQGPGIPPKDIDHIFERFYRVDKSRNKQTGGTGLGLAIVRHIALVHGGTIKAESWVGEGSTFTLTIPKNGPDFQESRKREN
jgi:two-component system phosphate regulon sensor histidine kinase PhoR